MNQKLFLTEDQVKALQSGFVTIFGTEPQRYFSAPGRTEIGGNHTDHQRGRAASAQRQAPEQALPEQVSGVRSG